MARYQLKKEYVASLATVGPITFGGDLPGVWYPGEANEAGGPDLALSEQEMDQLLQDPQAAAVIEKVGGGSKAPTAAERRKLQLDAEPASASPDAAAEGDEE